MRVLMVTAAYKPYLGGVERVAEQLCRRLAPRVEEVGLLVSDYRYPPRERMRELPPVERVDGATVFRLHYLPLPLFGFYHLDMGQVAPGAGRVLRAFRPTHVHYLICEWFLPNLQVFLRTRRTAAQVMTIFDHPFQPSRGTIPFQGVNRFMARRADAVHLVSPRACDHVADRFSVPREKMVVIPLGAEVPEHPAPGRRAGEPVTVLSVGRLGPLKGQLDLVRCFLRARERVRTPARLVLLGGEGGDRAAIEAFVRENGLREAVLLPGHVPQEELEDWYGRADVFALLTRQESFGLVFWEAMARGLPVITYATSGLPELLPPSTLMAAPGDLDAVVEHLAALIDDPERRERLSRQAAASARAHLSWDGVAEELLGVYRRCRRSSPEAA